MNATAGAALVCRACGTTVWLPLEVTVSADGHTTIEPTSQALTTVDAFAAMHHGPFGMPRDAARLGNDAKSEQTEQQ